MPPNPKRVAVVGCGAAGMSAAYALSKHSDKFIVTVFEKEDVPGGMATSLDIDVDKYGASYINDGVQGCSPAFANTLRMFFELGFKPSEVGMQISFGKGPDFWSNVFPSQLTTHFRPDIRKFGRILSIISALEFLFVVIPVHVMLFLFRFSKDFGEKMVYPLVALFFGTGNQTPFISCVILERVFKDPSMRLFEYNDTSLLASIPTMYAFPKLHDVYTAWRHRTESANPRNVTFLLNHTVTRVITRDKNGVVLEFRAPSPPDRAANPGDYTDTVTERFDALILAVDAAANTTTTQLFAAWPRIWASHLRLPHAADHRFLFVPTSLFPNGFGQNTTPFETADAIIEDLGRIPDVEFVVEEGEVLGFGLSGTVKGATLRTKEARVQDRADVWFERGADCSIHPR
ncbi:hypothetical protein EWM64_g6170 [Hericium alpestre]|uniref:Amine oxidase domain-containing protein n=1 Tax=Hericium alpestre TaxID=135208 RepID=A0A4Y9ZUI3_9AGAM|nr:hypothetical protein EWM64_g6170 [Hericium alpestre]